MIHRNENFIKGKTAEGIIERLFIELGYEVYQFGVENTFPSLVHRIKENRDSASESLRSMPDFVVYDVARNLPFFLEVKFRENEELFNDTIGNLKKSGFKHAFVILVSKDRFMCLTIDEITRENDRKKFARNSNNHRLQDREEFKFTQEQKNLIELFLSYPKSFFPK